MEIPRGLGRLLRGVAYASGLGATGALGYGLSRRHDFTAVKVDLPGGRLILAGERRHIDALQRAAKEGDQKAFEEAFSNLIPLGGSISMPPQRPGLGQGQGLGRGAGQGTGLGRGMGTGRGTGLGGTGAKRKLAEFVKSAGISPRTASILKALGLVAGGGAAGALAAGIPLSGRQFAMMNIDTPVGPIPVAGQKRWLKGLAQAAKKGDRAAFAKNLGHLVPLHPGMAGVIAEQAKQSSYVEDMMKTAVGSFFRRYLQG